MSIQEDTAKSKRVKKPVESCNVCAENYTPIIRKKCVCKYCNNDTCSKCIERYLLDRHEDAHCLKCRVNYNDAALHDICTKTYIKQVYFKHRQEVLINRERANLPGLQDEAINARRRRDNETKIAAIRKEIAAVRQEHDLVMANYNQIITQYYSKLAEHRASGLNASDTHKIAELKEQSDEIITKSNELRQLINIKQDDINRIKWPGAYGLLDEGIPIAKPEEEKKKFIRRCTHDGCQGFLSTAWKCGICDYYSCPKCFKVKTMKHDDPHECAKEDLETAELIKKDCKSCPNCGEFIMKTSGCFAADVPILMWNGNTKMSQNIIVGDELCGDDAKKRTVLDTTTGVDTLYEVKQDNGITYVVNSKHTLVLKYNLNDDYKDRLFVVEDYIKLSKIAQQALRGFKFHYVIRSVDILNECEVPRPNVWQSEKSYQQTSIQVTELGPGEYYGWKVDGNNQFLLSDTTVVRNCSQMWCISCQTPWDWTTGKIVTNGIIHNPHYYEWMKRNGGSAPRNPADIPCGGYPNVWELRKMPHGVSHMISTKFYEFHRICQELQDVSERGYRSHIDNTTTTDINVKFLIGDFDEKRWGQNLAKNEKKRKRDSEVQEIFVAFRMVAVELINRLHHYDDGHFRNFNLLPAKAAEKFIETLDIEIQALIIMINEALRNVSISYCYSVPYINLDGGYYGIKTKNFSDEVKKKKKDIVVGDACRDVIVSDAVIVAELWSDTDDSDEDIISAIEYKRPPSAATATYAATGATDTGATDTDATNTDATNTDATNTDATNTGATNTGATDTEEIFNELDRIQKTVSDVVYSDDENTAIQLAIVASLENK